MCIAVPAKIEEISEDMAIVNYGGVRQEIYISFIEEAKVGDYVLIHAGCAIEKIIPEEAIKTLELFEEVVKAIDIGGNFEGISRI